MRTTTNTLLFVLGALVFAAAVLIEQPWRASASVVTGDDYQATTTNTASAAIRTIKAGYGSLGQVTITGANTGLMTFYNATTSDVTLRTGNKATSTIIIADFPASAAAGTYLFDARFSDGLLLVTSGSAATSSIMYK